MSDQLRWGILGTGNIAAKFAAAVQESPSSVLAAVGSRSAQSAREFAERFEIPHAHPDYEDMIEDGGVDAVYISTPHPFHAEWVIKAAEAGRHILCEKPVTMNLPEYLAAREVFEAQEVFFMEAFMYRCHPQMRRLLESIRAGVIGEVQMIDATFAFRAGFDPEGRHFKNDLGGGGILDVGCYPLSMARAVAGAALGIGIAEPHSVKGAAYLGETGVDEVASAVLDFDGGILAKATCAVRCQMDNRVVIHGTNGRIDVPYPWWSKEGYTILREGKPEHVSVPAESSLYVYEIEEVAQAIREGRREALYPAMTPDDTEGNMRALDLWRQSVGLEYKLERPDAPQAKTTVANRPLRRWDDAVIPHGQVPGLEKSVSRVAMGAMGFKTYKMAEVMLDTFYERGGNCLDTAYIYGGGASEMQLGAWLANRGVRDEVVILGKGGHTPACWPDMIRQQFDISLQRMRTDYVDIYMLHRDNEALPVADLVDVLADFVIQGRALTYGFSNWSLPRIQEAIEYAREAGLPEPTTLSQNFSLARMIDPVWPDCKSAADEDFRLWLEENQDAIALIPWSSQARGFFTDRSGPDKQDDRQLVRCWYSDENFERKRRAQQLAEERGVSPLNIALAYCLNQPFAVFPLIGPQNPRELRTALPALQIDLSPDEVAWLDLRDEREEPQP